MVATAAFVLAFIVLALGVLLLAFGGGPRGARQSLHRSGRSGRKTILLTVGVLSVVFGLGIPALGIALNESEQSKAAPGGVDLTTAQAEGREIFADRCGTCHTMRASNSVGKVGPNLDRLNPPKALTLDAIEKGRARGKGQMPSGLIDGQEAEDVADFIVATAGR